MIKAVKQTTSLDISASDMVRNIVDDSPHLKEEEEPKEGQKLEMFSGLDGPWQSS